MLITKPPKLNPGDRIGIISPAGPVAAAELEPGLAVIESAGFEIRLGEAECAEGA